MIALASSPSNQAKFEIITHANHAALKGVFMDKISKLVKDIELGQNTIFKSYRYV